MCHRISDQIRNNAHTSELEREMFR